jgi:hypothetical protein
MGRIIKNPGKKEGLLDVELRPEEVIFEPFYLPGVDGGKPHYSGTTIGDAIRRLAWRKVYMHAPEKVEGMTFQYGDVSVDFRDGENMFVIRFYGETPKVPNEPGGP